MFPQQARHVEAAAGSSVCPAEAGAGTLLSRNHHARAVPAVCSRHQCENLNKLLLVLQLIFFVYKPIRFNRLLPFQNAILLNAFDFSPCCRMNATRCDSVFPRSSIEACAASACLQSTWLCLLCVPRTLWRRGGLMLASVWWKMSTFAESTSNSILLSVVSKRVHVFWVLRNLNTKTAWWFFFFKFQHKY